VDQNIEADAFLLADAGFGGLANSLNRSLGI
jgi:hypothetical protein